MVDIQQAEETRVTVRHQSNETQVPDNRAYGRRENYTHREEGSFDRLLLVFFGEFHTQLESTDRWAIVFCGGENFDSETRFFLRKFFQRIPLPTPTPKRQSS